MKEKIVIFTGSGVSAESGIPTFRDANGLWKSHSFVDLASPEGFARNPALVLDFYNQRREVARSSHPNAAHLAIARLESKFDVIVVTQSVDDLHERAGSSPNQILHLHGSIFHERSSVNPTDVRKMTKPTIELGDLCAAGSQLRPDVVWFGEEVRFMEESAAHFATASRLLVIGTSLSVYPAAGLVNEAKSATEKYLVSPDPEQTVPASFTLLRGFATTWVPYVVDCWLEDRPVDSRSESK
jgi:NAD-dependent deacetylase